MRVSEQARPRCAARRTTSVWSSGDITAPEGFEGEFRMMSLVRGLINRSIIAAVTRSFKTAAFAVPITLASTRCFTVWRARYPT